MTIDENGGEKEVSFAMEIEALKQITDNLERINRKSAARAWLGHEMTHCVYGRWHK